MKAILERIKQRYDRKVELIGLIDVVSYRIAERVAEIRHELVVDCFAIQDRPEAVVKYHEQLERMFLRARGLCPIVNNLTTEKAILSIELARHTWGYILTGRND